MREGMPLQEEEAVSVTFEDVVAAVRKHRRREFRTPEEIAAVVAAVDRGDVAIVPFKKGHLVTLIHNGIPSGVEKIKKLRTPRSVAA